MYTIKLVRLVTNTETGSEVIVTDEQWNTVEQLILAFGTSPMAGINNPAIRSSCCYFLSNQLQLEEEEVHCIFDAVKKELYE